MAIKGSLFDRIKKNIAGYVDNNYMDEISEHHKNGVKYVFDKSGHGDEFADFDRRFVNADKNLRNTIMGIQARTDAARGILNEGRIKSQHETGTSTGSYAPKYRTDLENAMFGNNRTGYPVYGWIGDDSKLVAKNTYGDNTFYPKESVKDRTTYSTSDSFESRGAGRLGAADYQVISPAHYMQQIDENEGYKFLNSQLGLLEKHKPWNDYIEAQIHGGLGLEDIGRVDFYPQTKQDVELAKDAASRYGFELLAPDMNTGKLKCIANCKD